ncbi:hypothetical protein H4582DRAFT_2127438 [Lactarius indigo]|nr:hypothetical protein H4582DRAFT_2127438 [Lactarius indigo]
MPFRYRQKEEKKNGDGTPRPNIKGTISFFFCMFLQRWLLMFLRSGQALCSESPRDSSALLCVIIARRLAIIGPIVALQDHGTIASMLGRLLPRGLTRKLDSFPSSAFRVALAPGGPTRSRQYLAFDESASAMPFEMRSRGLRNGDRRIRKQLYRGVVPHPNLYRSIDAVGRLPVRRVTWQLFLALQPKKSKIVPGISASPPPSGQPGHKRYECTRARAVLSRVFFSTTPYPCIRPRYADGQRDGCEKSSFLSAKTITTTTHSQSGQGGSGDSVGGNSAILFLFCFVFGCSSGIIDSIDRSGRNESRQGGPLDVDVTCFCLLVRKRLMRTEFTRGRMFSYIICGTLLLGEW